MGENARHGIASDVLGQFEQAWGMLEETTSGFSENQWREDAAGAPAPARLAYHLLETADFGRPEPSMLDSDPVYGDEGMSRLDRSLYLLRHTHHHIGELCARLRYLGLSRPHWR